MRRTLPGAAAAVIRTIVLGALGLAVLIPLYWAISSSFMTKAEFVSIPTHWWPQAPTATAYSRLLTEQHFPRYYLNSIIVSVIVAVSSTFFAALTGFALSTKYTYAGKNAFFTFILGTMLLPFELIVIPLYIVMRTFGLLNTYAALIIPGLLGAFGVFLLRQAINDIPNDFLDAGRIDGAHEVVLFARIIVPMAMPVMAALLVFTFVGMWNSYYWPLIVINGEPKRTLTLAIVYMQGFYTVDYPLVLGGSVLGAVPIMIVFAISQRFFIRSMTLSGLKG
jgi:multiple sugar transport system permease protein